MLSQLAGTLQCASFGILGNMFHSCSLSRAFHNFWVIPHFDPIGKKKMEIFFSYFSSQIDLTNFAKNYKLKG